MKKGFLFSNNYFVSMSDSIITTDVEDLRFNTHTSAVWASWNLLPLQLSAAKWRAQAIAKCQMSKSSHTHTHIQTHPSLLHTYCSSVNFYISNYNRSHRTPQGSGQVDPLLNWNKKRRSPVFWIMATSLVTLQDSLVPTRFWANTLKLYELPMMRSETVAFSRW